MARMNREFSLVLLGAGLLTAGYFLAPDPDPVQLATDKATEGAGQAANDNSSGGRRRRVVYHTVIIYHGTTIAGPNRAFGTSNTVRGGFGRSGARVVGG
jgi:hypothetical protein